MMIGLLHLGALTRRGKQFSDIRLSSSKMIELRWGAHCRLAVVLCKGKMVCGGVGHKQMHVND